MQRRDMMLAAGAALAGGPAQGQPGWAPSRPVSFIVPLAPGGTADIMARVMAEAWSPRLGQPVTVDNRPAAGGVVATEQLKAAPPDGHTIGLVSQGTLVFNSLLTRTPRYDALRDFSPIAPFAVVTNALVVGKASPFRTPADLVAAARARPGTVTYSSGGIGTSHHIAMALFGQLTGTALVHVPYRATSAGILAALTGEVASGCYNIPTVLRQIRAGELRALAVTSATRSEFLAEVPSLQELGFTGYELATWVGVAAPAGAPPAVVDRYAAEAHRALDDPALWARLQAQGFEPMPRLAAAGFAAFIAADLAKWGPVIRASGAVVD